MRICTDDVSAGMADDVDRRRDPRTAIDNRISQQLMAYGRTLDMGGIPLTIDVLSEHVYRLRRYREISGDVYPVIDAIVHERHVIEMITANERWHLARHSPGNGLPIASNAIPGIGQFNTFGLPHAGCQIAMFVLEDCAVDKGSLYLIDLADLSYGVDGGVLISRPERHLVLSNFLDIRSAFSAQESRANAPDGL